MADLSFYKYLEAAFRYKLYKNPKATSFNYLGYKLNYESQGAQKGLFEYARRILPRYYTGEFPDTEEGHLQMAKAVLEKLDRKQDLELQQQFSGQTVSEQYRQSIQEAQAQSQAAQQAPVGEPAAAMAGGGLPSIPMGSPVYTAPRTRTIISAPAAGKEGGTGIGTAAGNKAAELTGKGTAATEKAARLQQEYTAPATTKAASAARFQIPAGSRSFTNTIKNFGSRMGVFFQRNAGKYLTVGRLATVASTGIGALAGASFGGVGAVGGGILGAVTPSWVKSGGASRFFNRVGNGAINFGARLSNQAGGRFRLSGSKKGLFEKRVILWLMLGMLLVAGIGLLGAANPGGTPTGTTTSTNPTAGSGCPDTSTNTSGFSCHYLNPSIGIFNITIPQSAVDLYISKYSPVFIQAGKGDLTEFTKRVNYIVANSQQAGLNPAIFLGYWKTESYFSTIGSRDMGCAGNGFYEQVDCALGINTFSDPVKNPIANCARSKDANSSACKSLKSVRQAYDQTHPVKYPISTFDDFAESYGPYDHLTGGQPTNCISTYNKLIDTAKELNACVPTTLAVGPIPTEKLGQILYWTQKITDNLDPNSSDKLLAPVTNGSYSTGNYATGAYACTYLVIDAYNLASITGLTKYEHGWVGAMEIFWRNTPSYLFLDYQQNHNILGNIHPGYAMFEQAIPGKFTGDEHVSIVKEANIDSRGNGSIITLNSNSGKYIVWPYHVDNWLIKNDFTPKEIITGFGGPRD